MSSKIITVFGATGYQGTSVIDSLLQNKTSGFSIRGITRNPDSDKAKALAARGVNIVKADGLVKGQLVEAFKGSWGVFANTNSDDSSINKPGSPTESDLGKIIVDAAFDAGVQVFIYSGFKSAKEITNGAVPNRAFDEKAEVTEYAKKKGFKSAAAVSPGWYLENHLVPELAPLLGGFPFDADEEGYMTLRVPNWGGNNEIPFIGIGADFGDLVHGVFLSPEEYNGHLIQGISFSATVEAFVGEFEKVTGKKARFTPIEKWQDFDTYGMSELETVKYMFGFCQHADGKYYGSPNDVEPAKKLKARAAEAKGSSAEESGLITLRKYYEQYFS